ncbi:hypothetical protein RvY_06799 [Ramazzottius varieornatus]|uniref:Uncharacterized protein n=1 Tax=Ramazzottius varieornatus TaxID=947166 RepID=A0A1D1UZS4_RAMVA|nr:hypothetical protein RvY_06799 [Ramazzottius varieornatus]
MFRCSPSDSHAGDIWVSAALFAYERLQVKCSGNESEFGDPAGKVKMRMRSGVTGIKEHDAGNHLPV